MAEAARARGAAVVLVSGPTELTPPPGVETRRVETTDEMQRAVQAAMKGAAALFMAAAPADFRPATTAVRKQPRSGKRLTVTLEPTADILGSLQRPPGCLVVGFALETGGGRERALDKLRAKRLDYIILNDALEPGAGFEVATNKVAILGKAGAAIELPLLAKRDVAERILDAVEQGLT